MVKVINVVDLDYQQVELRVFALMMKRRPWYKKLWYKLFCKNIYR